MSVGWLHGDQACNHIKERYHADDSWYLLFFVTTNIMLIEIGEHQDWWDQDDDGREQVRYRVKIQRDRCYGDRDVWLVRNDIIRQNIRFESQKMIESDENSTFRIFIWVFYCPKYCKSAICV